MEKQKDIHIICLEEDEFNYLSTVLNSLYGDLKKFPKKFRTQNFYTLENIINNYFFTK